jgi:hypothetical protein
MSGLFGALKKQQNFNGPDSQWISAAGSSGYRNPAGTNTCQVIIEKWPITLS